MKKRLALIAGILFLTVGVAYADPWLVSDPNSGADKYILEVDGTEIAEAICESDGSLRHDMAAYAGGDHTVRAKAGNIWGWSIYSDPFNFNADSPGVPFGFGFSAE